MSSHTCLRVTRTLPRVARVTPRATPRVRVTSRVTPRVQRVRTLSTTPPSRPSSVSPDEVAHFNALASEWWDPYGSSRLLHQMNPLRHDFLRACIASQPDPETPQNFLDIGCGGGIFAESAARLATTQSVTAIDPSAEVLAVAKAHARKDPLVSQKLTYRQASVEDLPFSSPDGSSSSSSSPDGSVQGYDVVSLFEVLEHVAVPPGNFLRDCGRLVRPGGWLVLSTMARTWTSWLTTVLVAEDLLGIVPRGTHDWNKYVDAPELAAHFAPGGAASVDGSTWHSARFQGVIYVPGCGWKAVDGGEQLGNYFFAIRKGDGKD